MNIDDITTISEIKNQVKNFCEERDWDQFHNAKELAIGITTEASELLQHLRFKSEDQVDETLDNPSTRKEITEEISDILFFIFRFSERYNIDLTTEFNKKMRKNKRKYPISISKGSNKKYSEF